MINLTLHLYSKPNPLLLIFLIFHKWNNHQFNINKFHFNLKNLKLILICFNLWKSVKYKIILIKSTTLYFIKTNLKYFNISQNSLIISLQTQLLQLIIKNLKFNKINNNLTLMILQVRRLLKCLNPNHKCHKNLITYLKIIYNYLILFKQYKIKV